MNDQAKLVAGIAVIIIFFMALYCVWLHFLKCNAESHLKHKRELANYYEEKYHTLKTRHEYLKRGHAGLVKLYKINRKRNL